MRIGIVGLGLIGGSLAGALTVAGYDVSGCDLSPEIESIALDRRMVRHVRSLEALSGDAEVVVLCMPPRAVIDAIPNVASRMSSSAILSDVAGVKQPVIAAMSRLDGGPRCVGGHPMAGKAIGTIHEADPALFHEATYALVPTQTSDSDAMQVMTRLVEDTGARPVEISAHDHDEAVAYTSHLPQVLSSALNSTVGDVDKDMSGPGLAGMLRLAASDEKLWSGILTANRDAVLEACRQFDGRFHEFVEAVRKGDSLAIARLMSAAREGDT